METTTLEVAAQDTIEHLLDIETLTDEQLALVGGGEGLTVL